MTQPSQPADDDGPAGTFVAAWIIAVLLILIGIALAVSGNRASGGLDSLAGDINDLIVGYICVGLGVVGIFTTLAAGTVATAIARHTPKPSPQPPLQQYPAGYPVQTWQPPRQ